MEEIIQNHRSSYFLSLKKISNKSTMGPAQTAEKVYASGKFLTASFFFSRKDCRDQWDLAEKLVS